MEMARDVTTSISRQPQGCGRVCTALEELSTFLMEVLELGRGGYTHQSLKGRVLHEVIVQVTVGHHSVYLDAEGKGVKEPQAVLVPGENLTDCYI